MNPTANNKRGYSEGDMYAFRRNFNASRRLNYSQKVDVIKNTISSFFDMDVSLIKSRCRKHENATLKQLVSTFIYINCPYMPYSAIGEVLGGDKPYDHATIINSLKRVSNLIEVDISYRNQFDDLTNHVNAEIKRVEDEVYDPSKYYFLDLGNIRVADIEAGKSIVFSGMSMAEINRVCNIIGVRVPIKEFNNTGLQIIKKLTTKSDEDKNA